jgi:hypothetical protein
MIFAVNNPNNQIQNNNNTLNPITNNSTQQENILIVVVNDNQSPSIKLKNPIQGAIEVDGIIVAYGKNTVTLLKLVQKQSTTGGNSEELGLEINLIQEFLEDTSNINCIDFYPNNKLFFGVHDSGNITAWEPCDKGLVNKGIMKVCDSVRLITLISIF